MANTINWGKIYEKTAWGIGVVSNTINWGKIYADLVSAIPSFALNFNTISDDFTFTRSSFATRVNEFGLIETVTDLGSELVQNGDFEELGSELVTNGDFATDSDWTKVNSTISDGKGNLDSTSSTSLLFQPNVLTVGKTYKANFDVSNYNGLGICALINSSGAIQFEITSDGNKDFYFTHGGSAQNLNFRAKNGGIFSIDNISVKQVDPNDNWSLLGGWGISDGKANSSGSLFMYQNAGIQSNKIYKITYTVTDYTSGTFSVRLNGAPDADGVVRSGVGTYTEYLQASSYANGNFSLVSVSSFIGSIDNVVVQEVLEDDLPRIDYSDATFDVPVLGNELVVNGDFATDSNWAKQSGWSIANGKATFDINDYVSGNANIFQNCLVVGKEYVLTYDVVDYVQGYVRNVSRGDTILRNANGTYTEKFISNNVNLFFKANIGENTKLSIDNVSVKEVTAYTTEDKGAFLLEPQSTNLLPYSEDFSQWTVNGTLTSDSGISPDGTQNASLLEGDPIKGRLTYSITLSASTDYVMSMYVKGVTISNINAKFRVYEPASTTFIKTLAIGSQIVVGEWVRIEVPFTTNLGGTCQIRLMEDLAIGDSAYVWGAQVEELTYATSYIPTNGSAVTRSAELCVDATPTINSEEGTLYVEASALLTGQNRYVMISDGTTNNYLELLWFGTNDNLRVASKGTPAGFQTKTIPNIGQENSNKIAFKYSSDGISIYVNGSEVGVLVSDSSFAPSTLTTLSFSRAGALPFYGRTKDLKIYTEALSDSELEDLTTL